MAVWNGRSKERIKEKNKRSKKTREWGRKKNKRDVEEFKTLTYKKEEKIKKKVCTDTSEKYSDDLVREWLKKGKGEIHILNESRNKSEKVWYRKEDETKNNFECYFI